MDVNDTVLPPDLLITGWAVVVLWSQGGAGYRFWDGPNTQFKYPQQLNQLEKMRDIIF